MESWVKAMKAKLSKQINENSQVKKMVTELDKLNKEFASKKGQINSYLSAEKNKTVKQAQGKYKNIVKQVNLTQKQLDKDVRKTVTQIKKSALQLEKNLEGYKDKLLEQKTKVEKKFSSLGKSKPIARKTSKKTTAKKAKRSTTKSV